MRWFKHMTGSGQDEKLMRLKDEFGMAGYGAYWSILECIASQMNIENQQTSVTFSLKNWRKVTDFSPKKLKLFVTFASNLKLFNSEMNGEEITIKCDNLLKYKDEYTKKAERKPVTISGQLSGHSPAERQSTETETETDIYKHTLKLPKKAIIPYAEILAEYHEILSALPRVEKFTDKRKRYIKNLWAGDDLPDIKNWQNFFNYVKQSDFLMGRTKPIGDRKPFIATLEWITKPENYVKILEGNYHG